MTHTSVELAFGRDGLDLDLPADADVTVIRQPRVDVPEDPAALVADAIDAPVGIGPIAVAASGATTACILVCDITRPVPNGLFLGPLIERIVSGGVSLDAITVLIATGLHRPNLGDELREVIGDPWVLDHVTVVNHDATDDGAHVSLGRTQTRGTPVALDRRFVEADLKVVTGLVEPHFMAGYSGGRKVIAPGIAHHSTIRTFHSARFMEDQRATSCNLDGNPLHEEQIEILSMLDGPIYGLNTVIDDDRNLVRVTFGDIVAAHDEAVAFVRESALVSVGERFWTVVTSAAGFPLDATYYQTIKGMVTPLDLLEPGGTLIVASACSEGLGSDDFRAAQRSLKSMGPVAFLASLEAKPMADIDEWQTEMQLKALRRGRIELYAPGLSDADHELSGAERVGDLAAAVAIALDRAPDRRVAVIPEGPYVIPRVESLG